MPVFRNRPLVYRPRRSVPTDFGGLRSDLLLGGAGLVSDNFRDRLTIGSSNGFDGYGVDKAWTAQSGAFSCQSVGKLVCTSAGIVTIDPGVADAIRFEFRLASAPNTTSNSLVLRFADTSNYLRLVVTSTAAQFQTVIATTAAAIGTATTGVSPASGDVVIGSLIGNVFSAAIYRNGALIGTATTATNATGAGLTPVGFRSGDTNQTYSYLKVWRSS